MKRLIIFIFGFILILLYSCSKELIEPDQMGDLKDLTCGKYGPNKPHGPVFTVAPSEDATQALIDAFEAAKEAGPGAVVQLLEGQYAIGIFEIHDFNGYFRGVGKGKSIITNIPELPCEECWLQDMMPSLMTFVGGDVTISDMTIHFQDGRPCAYGPINEALYGDLATTLVLADFTAKYVPPKRYIKGVVKNVDFIGGDDGGYGVWNTNNNVNMTVY
jgi:hypothetical protein